jgi:UDP-N-acetylglucosamine acyltransferase
MEDLFHKDMAIDPQAIIHEGAEIAEGVRIGRGTVIGPKVKLARGVSVAPYAVISGRTTIGENCKIYSYASVGSDPQDLKYRGEDSELIIGKNNLVREYVNMSLGTAGGGGKTVIGDNNLFMVYTHIGHDSIVGNGCIFANSVHLGGHVVVNDGAVFGGCSAAHQFTRIGELAMIAGGSMVTQDVPPYCMVHGDRARISGLNVVGLRRSPIKNISDIKLMYRFVYSDGLSLEDAVSAIRQDVPDSQQKEIFLKFILSSDRGIVR